MAAHPRHTPQEMPRIGQRARPTTPFSTQRRALSERSRITITDDCWRCGGTGFVDRPYVECEDPRCHRIWTEEQVAKHLGHGWRSKRLPCGHTAPNGIVYMNARCQACDGGRELPQTVTFGELLVWMKDWFERWYAELSAETTAVQPTVERSHDQREREERNTPRLPDIPRLRRE